MKKTRIIFAAIAKKITAPDNFCNGINLFFSKLIGSWS